MRLRSCRAVIGVALALAGVGWVSARAADPRGGPATREGPVPAPGDTYVERVGGGKAARRFELVLVPGGEFWMGSPEDEAGRTANEGPRHRVRVGPFWMGRCEVTADVVQVWLEEWQTLRRGNRENK